MELHALRLSLTEQDLNELLRKYIHREVEVEDLRVRLTDQFLHITGVYPFFIPVRFETAWELGVDNGHIAARLTSIKAMGVPGNIFKSAVVKIIEDIAKKENWIRIVGDRFMADLELGCSKYAVLAHLHLKSITIRPGTLMLEAGH